MVALSGTLGDSMELPLVETCCHHWLIQPADGPVSEGVCLLCDETREFKNSIDDWVYDKDSQDKGA